MGWSWWKDEEFVGLILGSGCFGGVSGELGLAWLGDCCEGLGVFEASEWLLFVLASVALVAVPGPAVLFIVARSLDGGRRLGLVTAAGVGLGNLGHALAAAFGVSAVIASTTGALDAVRYLGAAYLVFLGARGFWGRKAAVVLEVGERRRSDFVKGILVALLNPKVILFLLAFLPQFVDAERGSVRIQLLVLGVSFVGIGWVGDSVWAVLAGTFAEGLRKGAKSRWATLLPSAVYIALGVATVFAF